MIFATVQNFDGKNRLGGGIWQGGAGLATGLDNNQNNYIYVSTGDGQYGASSSNYGDTLLKLNTELQLSDYFTPADWNYRWDYLCNQPEGNDLDLGSAGEMLVPDGLLQDPYKHIVIKGDKESYIWVVDRTILGGAGTQCTPCQTSCGVNPSGVRQQFPIPPGHQARTTPGFWYDGTTPFMYFQDGGNTQLYQYKLNCSSPGPICSPAAAQTNVDPSGTAMGYSAIPSISSNGNQNGSGVVWAIKGYGGTNTGLYAFNAEGTGGALTELYGPDLCPNDKLSAPSRFSVPTVANGYVFVGTQTDFDVFGYKSTGCH